MENNIIDATNLRPEASRIIEASMVNIDIPSFVKQIKNEKTWNESDRNVITVFKTNGLSIVLIALHQHAEMIKHKANGLISIQIIEGTIKFFTDSESIILTAGQMLALHSGIQHSLLAIEETVFLLTVTTTTKQFID